MQLLKCKHYRSSLSISDRGEVLFSYMIFLVRMSAPPPYIRVKYRKRWIWRVLRKTPTFTIVLWKLSPQTVIMSPRWFNLRQADMNDKHCQIFPAFQAWTVWITYNLSPQMRSWKSKIAAFAQFINHRILTYLRPSV